MRHDGLVRTTINLDPEVLAMVKQLSRQRAVPLGTIVSGLLRSALEPVHPGAERNGVPLFPPGRSTPPDLDLVNRLRD